MNKTIELVNLWGAFEKKYPGGTIDDFCRHHLAQKKEMKSTKPLVGGVVPAITDGLLLKIIGRISKLNMAYANKALNDTGLHQIEEFGMMVTIRQGKNLKKTEIIYANLFELSSGTDMLNRLKKRGLIKEYDDKEDKRSKRIELTAKGEKVVEQSKRRIEQNAEMLMHDMNEDDKKLCIQLLKDVEMKFSALWPKHKLKDFDDIYKEIVEGEQMRDKK